MYCCFTKMILCRIHDFSFLYVNDITVVSDMWNQHLSHVHLLLIEFKKSSLTLTINKSKYIHDAVYSVGHILVQGSTVKSAKVGSYSYLSKPANGKQNSKIAKFL